MQVSEPLPAGEPFASLSLLKSASDRLLKERPGNADAARQRNYMDHVEAFVRTAAETGALLNFDTDRQAAQSVVDYWSMYLYRSGRDIGDVQLSAADQTRVPDIGECPYRGLKPFRELDGKFFFGRRRMIDEALESLARNRFLAVIGSSGSGKSSLVAAGVIPAMREGAITCGDQFRSSEWQYLPAIVPGSMPLVTLARMVQVALQPHTSVASLVEQFSTDSDAFRQVLSADDKPSVVIIDQFEEVFTLCTDTAAQKAFVDALVAATRGPLRHTLIVTMRTEFQDYVVRLPALNDLFKAATLRIEPLIAAELRDAIEQPAKVVGLRFEDQLIDRLVKDVLGEPAGLPLLQFVLVRLFALREGNVITWNAYRQVGQWTQALSREADRFFDRLPVEEQTTARLLLIKMVKPGRGNEYQEFFSSRVARSALTIGVPAEEVDRVLQKLVEAGLVRESEGELAGDAQYEISHESLVRNWGRLVEWLDNERTTLRKRVQLIEAEQRWRAGDGPLLTGGALVSAVALKGDLEAQGQALDDRQTHYVLESVRAQQKRGRFKYLAIAAAILMLVGYAIQTRNQMTLATDQARTNLTLAAASRANFDVHLDLAMLVSVEAYLRDPGSATAQGAVLTALQRAGAARKYLWGLRSPAVALAFDDTNRLVAATDRDERFTWIQTGDAEAWSPQSFRAEPQPAAMPARLSHVAYSDDLRLVAYGDATSIAVRPAGGQPTHQMRVEGPQRVRFSRDGNRIVVVDVDDRVFVHDLRTSKTIPIPFPSENTFVTDAALDTSGSRVAVVSNDGLAVYAVGSKSKALTGLLPEPDLVDDLALVTWSPDSHALVTASFSGYVTLWSVDRELKSERTVKVHDGGVTSMIVSADSRRLITGGRDGKIVVLDLEFHQAMRTLLGHTRAVSALAVAPDGEHLASGDVGNTVIYWDLKQDWAIAAIDDTKEVNAIVLSGSGRRLATIPRSGSLPNSRFEDGTRISINNVGPAGMVSDGQRTLAIRSSARERFSVQSFLRRSYPQLTLDYDGDTVAVVDGQNVLLYPRDDGAPPRTLQGGRDVTCLALDPKGHALAMGLEEATGPTGPTTRVRVVTTGSEPQPVYESVVDAYAAACAFSPTGNQVAFSLGSRGVKVVSLGSPQTSHDLPMAVQSSAPTPSEYLPFLRRAQRGIAFSANGMMLAATGVDNSVFVWNTSTWQLIGSPLSQLSTTGMSVAFSGDSKILAAGSVDGSVALWTVGQRSDWLPLGRFDSSRSTARVAGFTLDNRSLIVGFDRGIATFDLDTQGWLRKACRIANRDLTKDEWSALFPGEPESTCRKALK